MSTRVLIVGISGGSLALLKPFATMGWLPHFDYLFRKGASGSLDSPLPPSSFSEWAALLSGKNPAYTGHFEQPNKLPRSYFAKATPLHPTLDLALCGILDQNNLRTAIVNVPIAMEHSLANGIVLDRERLFSDRSRIPSHMSRFFSHIGANALKSRKIRNGSTVDVAHIERCIDSTIYQSLVLKNVIESGRWDMVVSNFTLLDPILARYRDRIESIKSIGPVSKLDEVIMSGLKILDDMLGQVYGALDSKSLMTVFSGHSYDSIKKSFSLNRFLEGLGHLETRRGYQANLLSQFISPMLRSVGLRRQHLKSLFERFSLENFAETVSLPFSEDLSIFDWKRSRAFSVTQFGIHINLKGRETHGIVAPGKEYRDVGEEIIEDLLKFKNPETGEPIVLDVRWKDDIYSGPRIENFPDLLIHEWNSGYSFQDFDSLRSHLSIFPEVPGITGSIRKNGFFLINGPDIPKGFSLDNSFSIFDIAPTSLSHLDILIPEEMVGRPFSTFVHGSSSESASDS